MYIYVRTYESPSPELCVFMYVGTYISVFVFDKCSNTYIRTYVNTFIFCIICVYILFCVHTGSLSDPY